MNEKRDLPGRPAPEQLASYVDGELGPADHAAVEEWLTSHPADRAEVDADRRLAQLMQATVAPNPGDEAWTGVLERITAAPLAVTRRPQRPTRWIALVVGVAAAGLAAAALLVAFLPTKPVEPLPVVSGDEIEIISMNWGDVPALVVGQPPMHGPFILASAGDVVVDDTGHDVEVVVPAEQEGAPMIIRPQDPPPDKE
jgi:anti-sigma factor RsiW